LNDDLFIASVASIESGGASLLLPGTTTPTQKLYKRLASASIAAGDRVLCCHVSGTILILDKIV
jgi:hypothetical protein